MVIINPNNPCGSVYTHEHLEKVAVVARKLRILVIADEVYGNLVFGDTPFIPMGVFGHIAPVLIVGSLSKTRIVPGWRLGWVAVCDPKKILQETKASHQYVCTWKKVQRSLELGGLGIPNLEIMGGALQVRWLWLRKTETNKPWLSLDIPTYANVKALFQIAMRTNIGNGTTTNFWKDKWIDGKSISDIAPLVVAAVPTRTQNIRLVAKAMVDNRWAQDIQGGLSMVGLYELFQLSDILSDFVITQEDDVHFWRLEASGHYTAKSTYLSFFNGAIKFEPWRRIWKTWAPAKCKIFLWLVVRNRCWTADRLERRNLPHPDHCLLCDQEPENIQHILTTCVLAREFWFRILGRFNWQACTPSRHEFSFAEWWRKSTKAVIGRVA
ncbi:unnamed protein product [Urochloa humidicola]